MIIINRDQLNRKPMSNDEMESPVKVVYIAHPISGDVLANLQRVRNIFRDLALRDDIIPVAPYYIACQALDNSKTAERNAGIRINRFTLESGMIDEIWLYGGRITEGILDEINIAHSMGMPILTKEFSK